VTLTHHFLFGSVGVATVGVVSMDDRKWWNV